MANGVFQWWMQFNQGVYDNGWTKMETTVEWPGMDYVVPCLVKTGTTFVDGETRDSGATLYLIGKEGTNPDNISAINEVIGGTAVVPSSIFTTWMRSSLGGSTTRNGFRGYDLGTSSCVRGWYGNCYIFDDYNSLWDAIDNGDLVPLISDVFFDVYINGTDKPSLFVNWTANEDMSPVLASPKVWIGAQSIILDDDLDTSGEITVPNENAWNVASAGTMGYAGSYKTTYLSIMDAFEQYLNPISKVSRWGFDGVPEFVRLYLRMDYNGETGDLFRVAINEDGTLNANYQVPGSRTGEYDTVVRIHYGEPDYILPEDDRDYPDGKDIDGTGPGRYDPDNPPPTADFTAHEGQGFDGNAVLTKTYAVSASTLENIGQKLWTQSYFDVLKVQNNPIENIVAVKGMPMAFTGTSEEIKVGNIAFGIYGSKVASVQKITIGTIKYTGKYGNYLDLAPYTKTKLNLPYIGLIELDPGDIYNSTLKIEYIIDLVTGQCMAVLTLDGIPFMNCTGQMGYDIPITATDRVQTELRVASTALTAAGSAGGHVLGGDILGGTVSGASSTLSIMGADYTSQRTTNPSPACASYANHLVYLLIDRPLYQGESDGYKHLHGYPCHKYMNLGSLSGFVAVDRRTDINIAMTSEENQMLEDLLTQGIYV